MDTFNTYIFQSVTSMDMELSGALPSCSHKQTSSFCSAAAADLAPLSFVFYSVTDATWNVVQDFYTHKKNIVTVMRVN